MAENTINDFNTLPEQVQLNKEDIKTNTDNIQRIGDLSDTYHDQIHSLNTKVDTNTDNIATNTESIDSIKQSYLLKSDASNIYATIEELKPLQNSYLEVDLTTAGLAKIQANATIGTSITLLKDTDFIKYLTNTDLAHRTVLFTLYRDDGEEVYISKNIKLDIVNTTDIYYDNDQPYIWFAGMGVIKLGSASASDNNYLCYIAYDATYNSGLKITPVLKLN